MTGDYTGYIYSAGVTDATSSCGCHQTSANTSIAYHGRTDSASTGLGRERSEADASLLIDDTNFIDGGLLSGSSTHYAYCPYILAAFINNTSSSDSATGVFIQAYYYCDWDSSANACKSSLGVRTYRRCHPKGNLCDTISAIRTKPSVGFPRYGLFNVLHETGRFFETCTGGGNIAISKRSRNAVWKPSAYWRTVV